MIFTGPWAGGLKISLDSSSELSPKWQWDDMHICVCNYWLLLLLHTCCHVVVHAGEIGEGERSLATTYSTYNG